MNRKYERNISSIDKQNYEKLFKLIPDSLPDEIKQAIKSSIETLSKLEAEQEKFEEYVYQVNSDDIIISYNGLNRCRYLLGCSKQAVPTGQIIELFFQTRVHIKIFDIAKSTNVPLLKYEALWIICNLCFGTQQQIQVILDKDGIDIFFNSLQSEHDEIVELAIWGLSNIAGDNYKFRDLILKKGVLQPFMNLARKYQNQKSEIFKTLVWAITNLTQGQPAPNKIYNKDLLLILSEILIISEDEEILTDTCLGLSYLSQDENLIDILIQQRIIEKLILLLNSDKQSLIIYSLRTLGNILTGSEEQTNIVINFGIIQAFEKLIKNKSQKIRREVCWSLSNIAAGTSYQVKQIIQNDSLLKSLFELLEQGLPDIIEQIAYLMSNSVVYAELKDLDHLVMQYGFIQKMANLLNEKEKKIIRVTLEGIYEILRRVQNDARFEQYKKLIVDSNIITIVKSLQNNRSKEIKENASKVIDIFTSKAST
ncbi:unnamed protein product [Paramecium sonneborni]|uniref:Importin subunit alpha n=1 Tax=Paramecium sonneborni TaxID=65129 RepID=A0A8S1NDH6_9CILI|nr:unnamed protein product [Paramecium sonneborni]